MAKRITDYDNRIRNIYTITATVSSSLAVFIGITSLARRWFGSQMPILSGSDRLPMPPATAVLFVVLGAVLLSKARADRHPLLGRLIQGIMVPAALFPILVLLQSVAGVDLGMEKFFAGAEGAFQRAPIDRMLTVTAAIFSVCALSAMPLFFKSLSKIQMKYVSIALSSLPFTAGVLIAASYWQGSPLLYNGSPIPVDLSTALGFLALGIGLHSSSALHIDSKKNEHEFERHPVRRDLPAVITLTTGIALAVVLFTIVHRLEFKTIQNEFSLDTENYSVALEKGIEEDMDELRDLQGFYVSSAHVTRASFRSYANSVLSHHAGIYALQWIPRVAGAERSAYESAARREGFLQFSFTKLNPQRQFVTADKRREYFPVYFSEPDRENQLALGLDLASKPAGKARLDKARDTGAAAATGRIKLVHGKASEFAFLAVQPVYRNGLPHYTIEDRRRNLTGFVCGVFYIRDVAEAALKGINMEGIKISLVDDSAPPDEARLYSNLKRENSAGSILYFFRTLNIADRKWTVEFYPTDRYLSAHKTPYSWAILGGGLCFTILLTFYAFIKERHASEIERSNKIIATVLNSINASIAIVDAKDMKILACNELFILESGASEGDVVGKGWDQIMHVGGAPACATESGESVIAAALKSGSRAVCEHVLGGARGEERNVEVNAFPVKDGAGNIVQIVHVSQDITERKQAEKARLQEQQMQRLSAERQAVEATLRMLQAQIEPHFLFNTLANIITLVENDPVSAKRMLEHFTMYLRLSLQRSRKETSTLAQEAKMLRDYLSIFKMRLGPRLEFTIDIPPDLLELPFPPMLLQPLVENAIIHGIEPKIEGGGIAIRAESREARLRLTISDSGLGFSDMVKGNGMGLENVKARLQALYPGRADLVLEENVPCGVTAVIEVPL